MKKIFFVFVLLLSVAVVACKKDTQSPSDSGSDPNPGNIPDPDPNTLAGKVLGTWKFDSLGQVVNGQSMTVPLSNSSQTFSKDGKMTEKLDGNTYNHTYSIVNETTLKINNVQKSVLTIDANHFVYYYEDSSGKYTFYLSK